MTYTERKQCTVEGCNRMGRNKGRFKDKTVYGSKCVFHHRKYRQDKDFPMAIAHKFPNNKCSVCEWDKAPCDRHKLEPEKGYVEGNVVILCPNCHRLAGMGLLNV